MKNNKMTMIGELPKSIKKRLDNYSENLIPVEILSIFGQICEDPILMELCKKLFEFGIQQGLSGKEFKNPRWEHRDGNYFFIADKVNLKRNLKGE